jgi:hypothetical protein
MVSFTLRPFHSWERASGRKWAGWTVILKRELYAIVWDRTCYGLIDEFEKINIVSG